MSSSHAGEVLVAGNAVAAREGAAGGVAFEDLKWRSEGVRVKLVFLSLPTADDAIARVAARVQHGGHNVPADVIRNRFVSGLRNFLGIYRDLVDSWQWIDNSIPNGVLLQEGAHDE